MQMPPFIWFQLVLIADFLIGVHWAITGALFLIGIPYHGTRRSPTPVA